MPGSPAGLCSAGLLIALLLRCIEERYGQVPGTWRAVVCSGVWRLQWPGSLPDAAHAQGQVPLLAPYGEGAADVVGALPLGVAVRWLAHPDLGHFVSAAFLRARL
ncbi:hypothetical protein D3C81_1019770 [compost metagenome]